LPFSKIKASPFGYGNALYQSATGGSLFSVVSRRGFRREWQAAVTLKRVAGDLVIWVLAPAQLIAKSVGYREQKAE
jgi:hypothetical protein